MAIALDKLKIVLTKRTDRGQCVILSSSDGEALSLILTAGEIYLEDARVEAPRLHDSAANDVDLIRQLDDTQGHPIDVDHAADLMAMSAKAIARLSGVIDKGAKAWLSLDPGIAWEGDLGDAMAAAVKAIQAEREWVGHLETGLSDDAVRAGIDPTGCVGMAVSHLMSDKILGMRADAWSLIRRLERENRFPEIDQPGWMSTLKAIAGPKDPSIADEDDTPEPTEEN